MVKKTIMIYCNGYNDLNPIFHIKYYEKHGISTLLIHESNLFDIFEKIFNHKSIFLNMVYNIKILKTDSDISLEFENQMHVYIKAIQEAQQQGCPLVSQKDLDVLWERHLKDNLALYDIWSPASQDVLLDLGCGAGFLGIMSRLKNPLSKHTLILCDKNKKKGQFLRHMNDLLGLNAHILDQSVYHWCTPVTHIACRAFGTLTSILNATAHLHTHQLTFFLLKTYDQRTELKVLPKRWELIIHHISHMIQGEIWEIHIV